MVNNKINGGGYIDWNWMFKTPEVKKENNELSSNQVKLDEVNVAEKKPDIAVNTANIYILDVNANAHTGNVVPFI
jgi:hypothetical protein